MRWISNNDPPLYVWEQDTWYNQKTKEPYFCDCNKRVWIGFSFGDKISFPKKSIVLNVRTVICSK